MRLIRMLKNKRAKKKLSPVAAGLAELDLEKVRRAGTARGRVTRSFYRRGEETGSGVFRESELARIRGMAVTQRAGEAAGARSAPNTGAWYREIENRRNQVLWTGWLPNEERGW